MNDRVAYWLEIAEYDLETARALLQTGRYRYIGFMCNQVIEKALKAVIANNGENPPFIVSLTTSQNWQASRIAWVANRKNWWRPWKR